MLHGFRFRKGIKLFPCVRLNISKSGVSTTVGRKGASVNLSHKGTRGTVGLPGSGMSYSKYAKGGKGYYIFLAVALICYVLYLIFAAQ